MTATSGLPHGAVPHHDGSPLYVSTQSPSLGEVVQVRVRIPDAFGAVSEVMARSNPDREPRFSLAAPIASVDGWTWWQADVIVENPVHGYRFLIKRPDGTHVWLCATGLHAVEVLDAEDFRLISHPAPPDWLRSSVMYQIFPDRFARSPRADARDLPDWAIPAAWTDPVDEQQPGRSQQLYGGDLDGIVEHLDHLERLGVNLIYLTPFFPGRSNHRYDAASFLEVDPLLGGDDALIRLVDAAHARGMKIIGDLTSNHTGDGHEWFRAALGHPDAAESDFYYWLDGAHTRYESWLGVPSLPKLNWNSTGLRRRFIDGPDSVVATWLGPPFNLDGWRVDVANMTGRYRDEDLNAEVRRLIRATMIEVNPDTILLGESTNDATGDFLGDGWHGAMTYTNFTRPVWGWLSEPADSPFFGLPYGVIPQYTGFDLVRAHTSFSTAFPWRVRLGNMNALDTHDTPRFATNARPGTLPVAVGLSVTMPGVPVVFAGDEFGLSGVDGEASRTPMPWQDADEPSVAPIVELYAELIRLRREHPALTEGGFRWVHVSDDVLAFVREHPDESLLVVATRATFDVTLAPGAVSGTPITRHGGAVAESTGAGVLRLLGTGPSFGVWELPGVQLPPFAPR